MKTRILHLLLGSGLLASSAFGTTTFSQFFNNGTGTGGDDDASAYNWSGAYGSGATVDVTNSTATDGASVGVSQGTTVGGGAGQGVPNVTGTTSSGFLFILPDAGSTGASMLYTTHLTSSDAAGNNPQPDWFRQGTETLASITVGEIDNLSVYVRNPSTSVTMRFAIQTGGEWYVHSTAFTMGTGNGVYEHKTISNLTGTNAWYSSVFTPGTSLDLDVTDNSTVTFTGSEAVTGYGWYSDTGGNDSGNSRIRIDSFQVTAIPEPRAALLGGLGLLALLRRRRA